MRLRNKNTPLASWWVLAVDVKKLRLETRLAVGCGANAVVLTEKLNVQEVRAGRRVGFVRVRKRSIG